MNHACPRCGTAIATTHGRCPTCKPKATPEENQRKNKRTTYLEVYGTKRWRELRPVILSRDKYTCQVCGERGTTVGHIHPFTSGNDAAAWATSNLRCECLSCNGREASKRGNPKKRGTVYA